MVLLIEEGTTSAKVGWSSSLDKREKIGLFRKCTSLLRNSRGFVVPPALYTDSLLVQLCDSTMCPV